MKQEDEHLVKLFYSFLKSRNKMLFSKLKKGHTLETINVVIKEFPFDIPEEILTFYTYKNGYK